MFIDALQLVSDAQAFTGAAVSTHSIDLGASTPTREVGDGQPMGFCFGVDVAAQATTVKLEIIMATDALLTTGIIVLVESTRIGADSAAGAIAFLGLPVGIPAGGWLRYLGVRVTPAGGATSVTLTAWLSPQSFVQRFRSYAKGYVAL